MLLLAILEGPGGCVKEKLLFLAKGSLTNVNVGWPHFREVGELGSSSTVLLFIGSWAEIAQSRMATLPIVEHFDVLKDRQ